MEKAKKEKNVVDLLGFILIFAICSFWIYEKALAPHITQFGCDLIEVILLCVCTGWFVVTAVLTSKISEKPLAKNQNLYLAIIYGIFAVIELIKLFF